MYSKYFKFAFGYGVLRKLLYTKDMTYKQIVYDDTKKTVNTPILYTDYPLFLMQGGLSSMALFPLFIFNDMRFVEMKFRDINDRIDRYNYYNEKSLSDILFHLHLVNY